MADDTRQKRLEQQLARIQERIIEAEGELAKAQAKAAEASGLYSDQLKEAVELQKLHIEALRKELELEEKGSEAAKKLREEISARNDALKDLIVTQKETAKAEEDILKKFQAGQQVVKAFQENTLGLSSGFGKLVQSFAGGEAGLQGFITEAKTSILSGELLRNAVLKVVDVNIQFALEQDKIISNFRQQTGAGEEFNDVIRDSERATFAAGVTLQDTTEAVRSLKNEFTDFTYLNKGQRNEAVETTALLDKMGFSMSNQSKIMQTATQAMGMTFGESTQLLTDLASTARSLEMDIDELGSAFEANKDFLVRFGKDGQKVFEELAVSAKALGTELGTLVKVTEKFKTFDEAGRTVGRFNAILGGPFLNSIDMLNAAYEDPIEGIKMLRDGFDQAGKSVEDLSGAELEAFASALGLSTSETVELLGKSNEELEIHRMKQEELAEQAKAAQSIQEKLNNAMRGFLINLGPIVDAVTPLIDKLGSLAQMMGTLVNTAPGLIAFSAVLGAVFGTGIGLMMAMGAAGGYATSMIPVVGPAMAKAQEAFGSQYKKKALGYAVGGMAAGAAGGALLGGGLVMAGAGKGGNDGGAGTPRFEQGGTITTSQAIVHPGEILLTGGQGSEVISKEDFKSLVDALKELTEGQKGMLPALFGGPREIAVYVGQEKIDDIVVKAINSPRAKGAFSPFSNG